MSPPDGQPGADTLQHEPQTRVGRMLKLVFSSLVRSVDSRMQPLELTAMQWEPLLLLSRGRADTVAALARECDMDCGAMTRMLDRLEQKQLLQRQRSESDRRVVNLTLTDKGREAAAAIPPVIRDELSRHLQDFSEAEIGLLESMLNRMLRNGREADRGGDST
ncbi:MAG TPA: MarR family transcriptional regulator [Steroidobacteraceae bacterium]|nr:MarR family transcriptional regulator [Steroidobacteraceae bacterium]